MPPDEMAEIPADPADPLDGETPESVRKGLADWLWVPLLTVAVAAAVVAIGRATFVA